jgi:diadenosine tetraphosphatase ApaH/serine/threonine PP2A family protein phosphatase
MQYLIISDIHANLDALAAVLDAAAGTWDSVLVLGDLVGYGADPNAVVDRIRALNPFAIIRGNHDKAACGLDDGSNFNYVARTAAAWTQGVLTQENLEYLRGLPTGPVAIDDRIEICHGAPFDEDHYIFDGLDARRAIDAASRPACVFGHTHLPVIFSEGRDGIEGTIPEQASTAITLQPQMRYLINCGSVGQPRDGDPRAGFALYDVDAASIVIRRIPYAIESAQRKIIAAGLPHSLAMRLAMGR